MSHLKTINNPNFEYLFVQNRTKKKHRPNFAYKVFEGRLNLIPVCKAKALILS
jgi:hypothetical protein